MSCALQTGVALVVGRRAWCRSNDSVVVLSAMTECVIVLARAISFARSVRFPEHRQWHWHRRHCPLLEECAALRRLVVLLFLFAPHLLIFILASVVFAPTFAPTITRHISLSLLSSLDVDAAMAVRGSRGCSRRRRAVHAHHLLVDFHLRVVPLAHLDRLVARFAVLVRATPVWSVCRALAHISEMIWRHHVVRCARPPEVVLDRLDKCTQERRTHVTHATNAQRSVEERRRRRSNEEQPARIEEDERRSVDHHSKKGEEGEQVTHVAHEEEEEMRDDEADRRDRHNLVCSRDARLTSVCDEHVDDLDFHSDVEEEEQVEPRAAIICDNEDVGVQRRHDDHDRLCPRIGVVVCHVVVHRDGIRLIRPRCVCKARHSSVKQEWSCEEGARIHKERDETLWDGPMLAHVAVGGMRSPQDGMNVVVPTQSHDHALFVPLSRRRRSHCLITSVVVVVHSNARFTCHDPPLMSNMVTSPPPLVVHGGRRVARA